MRNRVFGLFAALGLLFPGAVNAQPGNGDDDKKPEKKCTAIAGTVLPKKVEGCPGNGPVTLEAMPDGNTIALGEFEWIFVLTRGTGLVIEQVSSTPVFEVNASGLYTIHSLVYDPATLDLSIVVPGVTSGFNVNALLIQGGGDICGALDVTGGTFMVTQPDAGTLSGGGAICLSGDGVTLTATPNGDGDVPAGYSSAYVLTSGAELTIQQLGGTPEFTVMEEGLYTIHTFVFPSGLDLSGVEPGVTTGGDVLELLAANDICASLDVAGAVFNVSNPNAGTLTGGGTICLQGDGVILSATANGDSNVPMGYALAYVLTSGAELTIQQLGGSPEFTVMMSGLYTIHTFVFPSDLDLSVVELGVTTGGDVLALLAANAVCASLDVTGAAFNVVTPNAGTMSADNATVCLVAGEATITATANGDSDVPEGYSLAYVLTSGAELTIQQLGGAPSFVVDAPGPYTIHSFVFPSDLDLSVVVPGTTTGVDVLNLLAANDICASLDVAGAQVLVEACDKECLALSGTLGGGGTVCGTDGATLVAISNADALVPEGFSLAYVLTSGTDLTIQQLGATPQFTVSEGGLYTIHAFVFPSDLDLSVVVPGATTGVDVLNLIEANDICASLDVAGAVFNVVSPDAGTITADDTEACLSNGSATLSATPDGNSNTPDGYSLAYVLTSGADLVIQQIAADPSFVVNSIGEYTIHTFVFPSDLDLSGVLLGITTGGDVLALLEANEVCASLDVAGAPIKVGFCDKSCDVDAGTIKPTAFVVCRQGGSAQLSAVPAGDAVVPAGYETLYVLTRGLGLTISQVSATPEFTVQQLGLYRIHTLVYNPATLDLGIVQFGVTTGFDVNGLLVQGGGTICAALDVHGAPSVVVGPVLCHFLGGYFNGAGPQSMDELAGQMNASQVQLLRTIENDAPVAVLNVFPNPARDLLNLEVMVLVDEALALSIINAAGQEMAPATSLNMGKGANRATIDVGALPTGTYLIRLTTKDTVITHRFTKVD